jgi:hypothetical protein
VGYATAGDFNYSSFGGVQVTGSAVLVKYTYEGDADEWHFLKPATVTPRRNWTYYICAISSLLR